jgi:hypothetical protein
VVEEKLIDGLYSWVYGDKTIFLWHRRNHNLMAMNLKFEDYDHPLVHYIKEHQEMLPGFVLENIHPTLPFAIIQGKNEGINSDSVITWDKDYKNFQTHLIFNNKSLGSYTFSNDGKWVYFGEYVSATRKDDFILMPVDPKLPHYLGNPILLGAVAEYPPNVTAMTRNPAGLVVADRTHYGGDYLLKKWDFTQAIPLIEKGK